ncbi:unnamed protein product [Caenorhabditis brenneri]
MSGASPPSECVKTRLILMTSNTGQFPKNRGPDIKDRLAGGFLDQRRRNTETIPAVGRRGLSVGSSDSLRVTRTSRTHIGTSYQSGFERSSITKGCLDNTLGSKIRQGYPPDKSSGFVANDNDEQYVCWNDEDVDDMRQLLWIITSEEDDDSKHIDEPIYSGPDKYDRLAGGHLQQRRGNKGTIPAVDGPGTMVTPTTQGILLEHLIKVDSNDPRSPKDVLDPRYDRDI